MYVCFFIVCFFASVIGAICGIGGGVIIKPLLDMTNVLTVTQINFLSGCTVLSMTVYAVFARPETKVKTNDSSSKYILTVSSAIGGICGRILFEYLKNVFHNEKMVGAVQAICLILITLGTLIFTIFKHKIKLHYVTRRDVSFLIGLVLGIISSFLGIGGGPINIVMLYFFFSMPTKEATENSLYIIFFSQTASLLQAFVTGTIPNVSFLVLLCMVCGGMIGGIVGKYIYSKVKEQVVERLFIVLMLIMIIINTYNAYQFLRV